MLSENVEYTFPDQLHEYSTEDLVVFAGYLLGKTRGETGFSVEEIKVIVEDLVELLAHYTLYEMLFRNELILDVKDGEIQISIPNEKEP